MRNVIHIKILDHHCLMEWISWKRRNPQFTFGLSDAPVRGAVVPYDGAITSSQRFDRPPWMN